MKRAIGARTILYPTPVLIVGSYDKENVPNLMNVAWGGICSSDPPCVCVSIRKSRKSYENIVSRGAFTINLPSRERVREADYVGIYSGHDGNKFDALGLTAVPASKVDAPAVKEFPMHLECKVLHMMEVGSHAQFIGEILEVQVDADLLDDNGFPDMHKIEPITFNPADMHYYAMGEQVARAFDIGRIDKEA